MKPTDKIENPKTNEEIEPLAELVCSKRRSCCSWNIDCAGKYEVIGNSLAYTGHCCPQGNKLKEERKWIIT